MEKSKTFYLIVGFLFAIIILLSISATSDLNSQKGRYEHHIADQAL